MYGQIRSRTEIFYWREKRRDVIGFFVHTLRPYFDGQYNNNYYTYCCRTRRETRARKPTALLAAACPLYVFRYNSCRNNN